MQSRDDGLLDADTDLVSDYRQAVAKACSSHGEDGISTLQSYKGRADLRGTWHRRRSHRALFPLHGEPSARCGLRPCSTEENAAAHASVSVGSHRPLPSCRTRRVPLAKRRRTSRVGSAGNLSRQVAAAARPNAYSSSPLTSTRKREVWRSARVARSSTLQRSRCRSIRWSPPASTSAILHGAMSSGRYRPKRTRPREAMNRVGGKSNTGEAERDPARSRRCRRRLAPFRDQAIASGRFRRDDRYLANADSCRSNGPRARSPARAASCLQEVDDTSRASGTDSGRVLSARRRTTTHLLDRGPGATDHDLKNSNPTAPSA